MFDVKNRRLDSKKKFKMHFPQQLQQKRFLPTKQSTVKLSLQIFVVFHSTLCVIRPRSNKQRPSDLSSIHTAQRDPTRQLRRVGWCKLGIT